MTIHSNFRLNPLFFAGADAAGATKPAASANATASAAAHAKSAAEAPPSLPAGLVGHQRQHDRLTHRGPCVDPENS